MTSYEIIPTPIMGIYREPGHPMPYLAEVTYIINGANRLSKHHFATISECMDWANWCLDNERSVADSIGDIIIYKDGLPYLGAFPQMRSKGKEIVRGKGHKWAGLG